MALKSSEPQLVGFRTGLEAELLINEALDVKMPLKGYSTRSVLPLVETKRKKFPSKLLNISGGFDHQSENLDNFPLRSWLFHYTSKSPKEKRYFWTFKEDYITLYLSENESLFSKQILLKSIKHVKLLKGGMKLKIVLQDSYIIAYGTSQDPVRCKKTLHCWHDALNESLKSYEKLKGNTDTTESLPLQNAGNGIFSSLQFVLDLEQESLESKKTIRQKITKNGGQISYIITKNTNFLVMLKDSLAKKPNTYKFRKAKSLAIPVISEEFVKRCIESGKLVNAEEAIYNMKANENFSKGKIAVPKFMEMPSKKNEFKPDDITRYKVDGSDAPKYSDEYQVAKFSFLTDEKGDNIVCVEAHVASPVDTDGGEKLFRVMVNSKVSRQKTHSYLYYLDNVSDLCSFYEIQVKRHETDVIKRCVDVPDVAVDDVSSEKLCILLNEMKTSAGMIHPEIVRLVETMWADSLGGLAKQNIAPEHLSSNKIRNAMIVLLKIEEALKSKSPCNKFSSEFYKHIKMKGEEQIDSIQKVAKKRELCQLLKDVVSMNENMWLSTDISSSVFQYSALRCSLSVLSTSDKEYKLVRDLMPDQASSKVRYKICNIYRVCRNSENVGFRNDLKNRKLLFHSSSSVNFVSILSRGLFMPSKASTELGVERTDAGKLGSGIYFTDSFEISSNFTTISESRRSRLMLVNEVALGEIYETQQPKPELTSPPQHFHSVKGINFDEHFEGSEFAIYNVNQQRMRYLIEFTLDDEVPIHHDLEPMKLTPSSQLIGPPALSSQDNFEPKVKELEYGLIVGQDKNSVNLEEFHVRGKIIDLVSEVTIFQVYRNKSHKMMEGKYVFPLNEGAAVCGFEAFINEKHVIGEVKEKEEAHREYKKAVAEGHGAYLMDEEEPNVFTVSLGNIPARARVVIKIRYICELETVDEPESCVVFSLPENLSDWKKELTLLDSSVTQSTTESSNVSSGSKKSSFMISIDMPFDILDISSPTHKISSKKTATQACVRLEKSSSLLEKNLRLLVKVAEIHVPRIWIEDREGESPDQVAMVTFFPEFDFEKCEDFNCTVLLDMSNSIAGELCNSAKHISSSLVRMLPENCRFNIVAFGSHYKEKFVMFENTTEEMKQKALEFIESSSPNLGASDLIHIMSSLYLLLEQSMEQQKLHNVFLISDGHLADEEKVLLTASQISLKSSSQMRFFTFGIGKSPNSHLLQSLSTATGGRFEHFLPTARRSWKSQLNDQISFAKQPVLTDVKIEWCNYEDNEPDQSLFVNVPEKSLCVFSGSRLTAYSFMPNCRKVTLHARILGQEFSTVVTASPLNEITGSTIHHLATKAVFKEYDKGVLAYNDYASQVIQDKRKSSVISLSIKHSVVCKFTSFIAVEKRKKDEDMRISTGPTIDELLKATFTDNISEISWQVNEMTIEDKIDEMLKLSKQMESSSVLRSRELAGKAASLCESSPETDILKKLLVSAVCARLGIASPGLEAAHILQSLLVEHNFINFIAVNKISRNEDSCYSDALEELSSHFWSDYSCIQLTFIPKVYRPSVIAAFVLLFTREPELLNDASLIKCMWDRIHACDIEESNDEVVYKRIVQSISDMDLDISHKRRIRRRGGGFSNEYHSYHWSDHLVRQKVCLMSRKSNLHSDEYFSPSPPPSVPARDYVLKFNKRKKGSPPSEFHKKPSLIKQNMGLVTDVDRARESSVDGSGMAKYFSSKALNATSSVHDDGISLAHPPTISKLLPRSRLASNCHKEKRGLNLAIASRSSLASVLQMQQLQDGDVILSNSLTDDASKSSPMLNQSAPQMAKPLPCSVTVDTQHEPLIARVCSTSKSDGFDTFMESSQPASLSGRSLKTAVDGVNYMPKIISKSVTAACDTQSSFVPPEPDNFAAPMPSANRMFASPMSQSVAFASPFGMQQQTPMRRASASFKPLVGGGPVALPALKTDGLFLSMKEEVQGIVATNSVPLNPSSSFLEGLKSMSPRVHPPVLSQIESPPVAQITEGKLESSESFCTTPKSDVLDTIIPFSQQATQPLIRKTQPHDLKNMSYTTNYLPKMTSKSIAEPHAATSSFVPPRPETLAAPMMWGCSPPTHASAIRRSVASGSPFSMQKQNSIPKAPAQFKPLVGGGPVAPIQLEADDCLVLNIRDLGEAEESFTTADRMQMASQRSSSSSFGSFNPMPVKNALCDFATQKTAGKTPTLENASLPPPSSEQQSYGFCSGYPASGIMKSNRQGNVQDDSPTRHGWSCVMGEIKADGMSRESLNSSSTDEDFLDFSTFQLQPKSSNSSWRVMELKQGDKPRSKVSFEDLNPIGSFDELLLDAVCDDCTLHDTYGICDSNFSGCDDGKFDDAVQLTFDCNVRSIKILPIEILAEAVRKQGLPSFLHQVTELGYIEIPEDVSKVQGAFSAIELAIMKYVRKTIEDAGGRSLGVSCFKNSMSMLLMSIVLMVLEHEVLKHLLEQEQDENLMEIVEKIENWMKVANAKYPSLYNRLELGLSWPAAAESVIVKIVAEIG